MEQLYNELVNGSVEYKDNGEVVRHPPSCLMLRAARAIKQIHEINNSNTHSIINIQNTIQQLHNENHELQRQLSALQEVRTHANRPNQVQPGSETNSSSSESVRDGKG